MELSKERTLERVTAPELVSLVGLGATAILVPMFVHVQWASGPIVNAILILALFLVGIRSALVLCLVPSLMALAGGLLPAVLAPAIPFIMLSNVILIITLDFAYQRIRDNVNAYFIGLVSGAFLKFTFLYFSIDLVSDLIIKQELAAKVAQLFSWTQFMTALTGGMIAFMVLKFLKRI
jgi:hypothetical protein